MQVWDRARSSLQRRYQSFVDRFKKRFDASDMAIDLGTANTLIYVKGDGVVLDEPSLVVVTARRDRVHAVGRDAKDMFGRIPKDMVAIRPLKGGVITEEPEIAADMIQHFIGRILKPNPFLKPKVLIAVPSGITPVEKRAVKEAGERAGAARVELMEEPMAAAIGARLDVAAPRGNMIVDIGGGTTEIAVISMLASAHGRSIRVAGDEMDEAIRRYVRERFGVRIGLYDAEKVKIEIGSATELASEERAEVSGQHLVKGVPTTVELTDAMVREAIQEPVDAIIRAILDSLEEAPPELSKDILSEGIVLAGGGSLIRGIGPRLHERTGLKISRARDPLRAVVEGAGRVLEERGDLRQVLIA